MWLGAVGVVGGHVGLEVELASKGTGALRALVLATGVRLFGALVARARVVIGEVGREVWVGLGTSLEVLGRHIAMDEARVVATGIVGGGLDIVAIGANVLVSGGDIE